jgi:transcriptional regulator with XRE-family HTH domain
MREVSRMDGESRSNGQRAEAARRFGQELRHRRAQAGLTQRGLADQVRYSREMVAAVERGRRYASHELAVRCDAVLRTGGVLARLWPLVEGEQVAADRRRGPRPVRPEPVRSVSAGPPAATWADWVETIPPAVEDVPHELIVRLREIINNLVPANARSS